ncbi:MAG: DUF2207 domain-containing protein [Propionibacteriaceae bacterium]|nr:DUF2207 domain-containing protein [Propionibacteriaceae bacterium]
MRRFLSALVACVVMVGLALVASPAPAAGSDTVTRFDVEATLDNSGTATVTQTIDRNFATPAHGIYVYFITRQGYDSSHNRVISYSNFQVSSPTGAPVNLQTSQQTNNIQLQIGDPNRTVSGTQTYVVSYTVSGIINPDVASSGLDELNWTVIGTGWDVPLTNVTVTVHGPAEISKTVCSAGVNYSGPCDANSSSGATATYTQAVIPVGQGLSVAAGWPAGTFPTVTIQLVSNSSNPFDLTNGGAIPAGVALVLTLLAAWLLVRINRRGRDEQFANVTPGMLPAEGDKVVIKRAEVRDGAVEFAPPKGIPPRLVGAIVREGTDQADITATIIDLAVRGYIHMEQQENDSFTLTRTNADQHFLNPVDQHIYSVLFESSPTITSKAMSAESFYTTYQGFQATVAEEFDAQNWYKTSPKAVVSAYRAGGTVISLAGLGVAYLGFQAAAKGVLGIGWLVIPLLVLGVGMLALAKRMPVRTPVGSAVAVQSYGFKKYLETAEADQIRWEEGQDIFSQYLPYAISFGCADRWAKVFQDLVAKGAPVPQPVWYTGNFAYNYMAWAAITHSIGNIGNSFTQSVSQHAAAQVQATGGSMGGSAFGGGFGGGIGGGGGGRW